MKGRMMGPIRGHQRDQKYLWRRADRSIVHAMDRIERQLRRSYAHYSPMDVGDRFFIPQVRGLKAYWVAPGGEVNSSTIRVDTLEPSVCDLKFVLDERKAELWSKEFWDRFEALMLRSLRSEIDQRMYVMRGAAGEPQWLLESSDPSFHIATWPVHAWAELDKSGLRFEIGVVLPVAAACVPTSNPLGIGSEPISESP